VTNSPFHAMNWDLWHSVGRILLSGLVFTFHCACGS